MPCKLFFIASFLFLFTQTVQSQKAKSFSLASPDGKITVAVAAGDALQWSVSHGSDIVILPSNLSIQLPAGEVIGRNLKSVSSKKQSVSHVIEPVAYKKKSINDNYNELTLTFKSGDGVIFRAYNEAAAYRFFIKRKTDLLIESEEIEYNFNRDYKVLIPFTSDLRDGERYSCSFEEFYTDIPITQINKDTLGYLPMMVMLDNNKKAVLLEADVQDYPCQFIKHSPDNEKGLKSTFAPYAIEEALGRRSRINYLATRRADYIAKVKGTRNFPWRVIVISEQDKDLLNNDIVQKLSAPPTMETSWLKPGKVAWDWWNDWNISKVDFRAGINNDTYKYYIDFASANKLEYIILDEGWSDDWDLTKLKNQINLQELVEYGKQKSVGLILWSTWYALQKDINGLCKRYADMGIKGFKVDFLDRNDQKIVASCYEMASIAAKHHLMLDFHGMFAPQGLQRTWPNVINFEGVRGMEYSKWSADERVPAHEVSIPYLRMMGGPLDYTPGAMRNTTKGNARPNNSLPVSQGTRCHQLAMYVTYEAPLQMMADNPTAYKENQECTDFIARIPTVFDETVALDGKVAEYTAIARKKDNTWYAAAMNNWTARELTLDLSFLGKGNYRAEIFQDGINADRDARDYKKETKNVSSTDKITLQLKPGGGWAAIITKQ
jgi:alpha-glucosidase